MNQQQRKAQELELLLQNNSYTTLLEVLGTFQTATNLTGTALDACKFLTLQKLATAFASTASNQQTKQDFHRIAFAAKERKYIAMYSPAATTTPSTSSPSN